MKNYLGITIGVFIGLISAGIIWLAASPPRGQLITLLPTTTQRSVVVYVTGAVVDPGMYTLPVGNRIGDAVQAAGGFVVSAEQEQVNLATVLQDGMQIKIPGGSLSSHISAGRVNINTATLEELDSLPGIGPTTAQNIIDYRLANGFFQVVQDIQNVTGIGPSTYDRIKDFIIVGP